MRAIFKIIASFQEKKRKNIDNNNNRPSRSVIKLIFTFKKKEDVIKFFFSLACFFKIPFRNATLNMLLVLVLISFGKSNCDSVLRSE